MNPEAIGTEMPNTRRHVRIPAEGRVEVGWSDRAGFGRVTSGTCKDISPTGIAVELRDQLEPQTYVTLRAARQKVNGSGSVRYCFRKKLSWVIGIEFSGGLTWRPSP